MFKLCSWLLTYNSNSSSGAHSMALQKLMASNELQPLQAGSWQERGLVHECAHLWSCSLRCFAFNEKCSQNNEKNDNMGFWKMCKMWVLLTRLLLLPLSTCLCPQTCFTCIPKNHRNSSLHATGQCSGQWSWSSLHFFKVIHKIQIHAEHKNSSCSS